MLIDASFLLLVRHDRALVTRCRVKFLPAANWRNLNVWCGSVVAAQAMSRSISDSLEWPSADTAPISPRPYSAQVVVLLISPDRRAASSRLHPQRLVREIPAPAGGPSAGSISSSSRSARWRCGGWASRSAKSFTGTASW